MRTNKTVSTSNKESFILNEAIIVIIYPLLRCILVAEINRFILNKESISLNCDEGGYLK